MTNEVHIAVLRFSQIYVHSSPSSLPGTRWIELAVEQGGTLFDYTLISANGGGSHVDWRFGGPDVVDAGDSVILCEDAVAVASLFPNVTRVVLYQNADFFQHLLPTGGDLWLWLRFINHWFARVAWGDGNGYISHPDAPNRPVLAVLGPEQPNNCAIV